ncbi:DUF6082 family protein [Paractinoplanes rishiriensis]|uniref:Uncharacterized protein n=1 Tax=Paractinoplanes rishiriensis TaxID=1050105 RepID=A0A919JY91_9ACTN|nr:DUF6082 family protein [Actinoplanes rishiriensis]GIE95879.1 hypothetical protein Ari01nite_33440 [Actinoplanes rishiriensis]
MAAGKVQAFSPPDRRRIGIGALALSLIVFVVAMAGVVASPAILGTVFVADARYASVGDVGQAYGAASAVVAVFALFVVMMSVFVQYRQLKAAQGLAHAEANEKLVQLAMERPEYQQCWGARIAPEGIGEDLFYYCSSVIKHYTTAWELRLIDESQAREYLQNLFDSEVPRRYWERNGNWHRRGRGRNRRERFRDLINDEYLSAVRNGPPSRAYEPAPAPLDNFPVINAQASRARTKTEPAARRPAR